MRRLALMVALAGCSFDRTGVTGDDLPPAEAGAIDGPLPVPDGTEGCSGWTAPNVDPCDPALPAPSALVLDASIAVYDTDAFTLTTSNGATSPPHAVIAQTNGPDLTVINLSGFDLPSGGTLRVRGSRPLVIVVHGSASIDGDLDLAAAGARPGPGGDDLTSCGNGSGNPGDPSTSATAGGGGGGGGGFGDDGGDGSDGNGGGHGAKGTKGKAVPGPMLVPLRAGCGGGKGGDDFEATVDDGGPGGAGGGALEITAHGSIDVTGRIRGGGGGGTQGGVGLTGGGGGGAGGAVLLDAEAIVLTASATVCANGGGGGEGNDAIGTPQTGEDAACSDTHALGGAMTASGGDGGDGGARTGTAGTGGATASSGAGGGGGGGAIGRIRIHGRSSSVIDDSAVVTPAPAS